MKRIPVAFLVACLFTIAGAVIPQSAKAQGVTYSANVGAETKDQGVQADAFLPNEIWLLENDSITWTFVPKNEIHTVTLLTPGQVRPNPPPPAGPPFVCRAWPVGLRLFTMAPRAFPLPLALAEAQRSP